MKHDVKPGTTDYTVLVLIRGDDGAPESGLAFGDIDIAYARVETDNDVTTADVTPADLATPALTDVHLDWGFLEVSATDHPGLYRLDIADAVLAAGAWSAVVTITGTGLDPTHIEFTFGVNVSGWLGATPATPTVAGVPEVDQTHRLGSAISGAELALADLPVAYQKNVAVTAFVFYMELSADGSPGTGLTVTATVSKDGGAFAGLAGSVTEISAGWYEVDIAQAEMNADEVALKFTATGAKQRNFKIRTQA